MTIMGSDCLAVILLILQNLVVLSAGLVQGNHLVESRSAINYISGKLLLSISRANVSLFLRNESISSSAINNCKACKIGENGKICTGHGECECAKEQVVCRCSDKWFGDVCQYRVSAINCENIRHCVLCAVYDSGPFAEGNDCELYCKRRFPVPQIVQTLHLQGDENLCSFIYRNTSSSGEPCRYFFKYGKMTEDGNLDPANFYITSQQEMDCRKIAKFPRLINNGSIHRNKHSFKLFSNNYKETLKNSENEDGKKNMFITVVIIYILIALPIVTCIFALLYNFSNLPCGLCNIFRQPSAKYLRNVRPYPGLTPNEQITTF